MNSCLYIFLFIALSVFYCRCTSPNNKPVTETDTLSISSKPYKKNEATSQHERELAAFIPKGYIPFDTAYGDLNKDGLQDCILIIKGTDEKKVVMDEYRGRLDRNRRGIIVLFRKGNSYEVVSKNYNCFSSENEDGGVYFAPEMSVYVENGNLNIHYNHGRYGFWRYVFRYGSGDFEMIGYDASNNRGPVVESAVSINFLTKKRQERINMNKSAESGNEQFEEKWSSIQTTFLYKLSEIKDFDEFAIESFL